MTPNTLPLLDFLGLAGLVCLAAGCLSLLVCGGRK